MSNPTHIAVLRQLKAILTQPVQTSHLVGPQWFDGLNKRDFENGAVLNDIRKAIAAVAILRGDCECAVKAIDAAIAEERARIYQALHEIDGTSSTITPTPEDNPFPPLLN